MYCQSCGSFIPDDQAVCPNCGAPAYKPEPQPVSQTVELPAFQPSPSQPDAQPVFQQPVYQQPAAKPVYSQPAPVSAAPAKRSNGLAVAGLILGILSLIFCWVPVLVWVLGLFGLIFSIAGIAKKNASGKGMGIAGLVMSIIAGIIGFFTFAILSVGVTTYLDRAKEASASLEAVQSAEDDLDFDFDLDFDLDT
jgi:uncharacterized paraquat-inducible protein A